MATSLSQSGQSPRRRAGERVPTVTPVQINSSYAHTREELQLIQENLAACSPEEHLSRKAALKAFRDGAIPSACFELGGRHWHLTARTGADGQSVEPLATPLAASPAASVMSECEDETALASLLEQLARNGDVLVAVCDRDMTHPSDYLTTWVRQVQHLGLSNALVLSRDRAVVVQAKALGIHALLVNPQVVPKAPPATRHAALKWVALGLVLDLGYSVLYSDLDVGDCLALDEAPASAPRRRVIAGLSPGLLYLRPTPAAKDLAASMMHGLQAGTEPEGSLLDRAALAPAQDEYVRPIRPNVLPVDRFMTAAALFGARQGPAAVLKAGGVVAVHFGFEEGERLRGMRAVIDFAHGRTAGLKEMTARADSTASGAKRQQKI